MPGQNGCRGAEVLPQQAFSPTEWVQKFRAEAEVHKRRYRGAEGVQRCMIEKKKGYRDAG